MLSVASVSPSLLTDNDKKQHANQQPDSKIGDSRRCRGRCGRDFDANRQRHRFLRSKPSSLSARKSRPLPFVTAGASMRLNFWEKSSILGLDKPDFLV